MTCPLLGSLKTFQQLVFILSRITIFTVTQMMINEFRAFKWHILLYHITSNFRHTWVRTAHKQPRPTDQQHHVSSLACQQNL